MCVLVSDKLPRCWSASGACPSPVQVAPVHEQLAHGSGQPGLAALAQQLLKRLHQLAGGDLVAGIDAAVERDGVEHL